MLYVVNYKNVQVHSPHPFREVSGGWVYFEGGGCADVTYFEYRGAVAFVRQGEPGYIYPLQDLGTMITVTDVGWDGSIRTRTREGETVAGSSAGRDTYTSARDMTVINYGDD